MALLSLKIPTQWNVDAEMIHIILVCLGLKWQAVKWNPGEITHTNDITLKAYIIKQGFWKRGIISTFTAN